VLLGLAGYTALAVEATSLDWPAFRFTDDLGTSASTAAWAYVAVTGGMTLGRFAGDSAAVLLGKERLVDVAIVVNVSGLILATMVDSVAAGLIGYAAAGIGVSVFLPEIYDQAAKFPGRPGSGLGALTAGLRLAALTVPLLVGALIAVVGTIGGAVALCAIPSAIGFGVVARLARRYRQ
jgi:fucose permease